MKSWAALLGTLISFAPLVHAAETTYWVGEAHESLDPKPSEFNEVYLGGYGIYTFSRGHMESIHDSIYARSLAIRDASSPSTLIMTVIDAVGISNRTITDIQDAFKKKFPSFQGTLLISATHTHSAPDLQGLYGWVPSAYLERLKDKTVTSMARAYTQQQSAWLYAARGAAIASNRRGWGYTDDELTVLQAISTSEPHPVIATLVNFAAHLPHDPPGKRLVPQREQYQIPTCQSAGCA